FGKAGAYYHALARGIDERPVCADRIRKSVGAETTFISDLFTLDEARAALEPLIGVHPEGACANLTLTQVVVYPRADDSAHQGILRLMDRQDLQLEELQVPEPVRLPFHRLDLVVGPLQRTTRDHHVVVGQQPAPVRRQRLGHLLEDLDPRGL